MKKTLAALMLVTLATGATYAQSGRYNQPYDNRSPYGNRGPQYGGPGYDRDQVQDDLKIDRIDAIVGLSRRQERQLRRIENNYDQLVARSRFDQQGYRQLMFRKRQDMLAVLTSGQRDRLFAYHQNNRYPNGNRPFPNGRRG